MSKKIVFKILYKNQKYTDELLKKLKDAKNIVIHNYDWTKIMNQNKWIKKNYKPPQKMKGGGE